MSWTCGKGFPGPPKRHGYPDPTSPHSRCNPHYHVKTSSNWKCGHTMVVKMTRAAHVQNLSSIGGGWFSAKIGYRKRAVRTTPRSRTTSDRCAVGLGRCFWCSSTSLYCTASNRSDPTTELIANPRKQSKSIDSVRVRTGPGCVGQFCVTKVPKRALQRECIYREVCPPSTAIETKPLAIGCVVPPPLVSGTSPDFRVPRAI